MGSQGIHTLVVPLKKGKNAQKNITEVEISYDSQWIEKHLKTIQSFYGKSPYFAYLFDGIKQLYLEPYKKLFELNQTIIKWILDFLDCDFTLDSTEAYIRKYQKNSVCDCRNLIIPGSKKFQAVLKTCPYPQCFADRYNFVSNLSILDLLFCTGKEASVFLMELSKQMPDYSFQSFQAKST